MDTTTKVTVKDLLSGETLQAGVCAHGRPVTVQGFTGIANPLLIHAIKLDHILDDGSVCSKWMPIRHGKKRKRWFYGDGKWELKQHNGLVSLAPSVVCNEHYLHGMFQGGEFVTFKDLWVRWTPVRKQIDLEREARDLIEEFGGGMEGAVLALASKLKWRGGDTYVSQATSWDERDSAGDISERSFNARDNDS